jgi:hypothetical protein
MGTLQLDTTLQPRGPAAAIVLTDEQATVIGEGAKAFPGRRVHRRQDRPRTGHPPAGARRRPRRRRSGQGRVRGARVHPSEGVRALDRGREARGDARPARRPWISLATRSAGDGDGKTDFKYFAGPAYVPARDKCIQWHGGTEQKMVYQHATFRLYDAWKSRWSHCD